MRFLSEKSIGVYDLARVAHYVLPAIFVLSIIAILASTGLFAGVVKLTISEVQVAALTLGAIVVLALAFLVLYFKMAMKKTGGERR
jgi:uncharacterized membrane protein YdbT with pleckstrin-like domain